MSGVAVRTITPMRVIAGPIPRQRQSVALHLPRLGGWRVLATVRGAYGPPRIWELHDDAKWRDTHGNVRSGDQLRDVQVLPAQFQPPLGGAA